MGTPKIIDNESLFADVEHIIGEGGSVQLRVKGGSMRPFLRDGRDTVTLVAADTANLRKGMVVLFRHGGRHVLHRIRRIDGDRLTIKGDGNYRMTEMSRRGNVAAVAVSIERNSKTVDYGSTKWKWLSFGSLTLKSLRTPYLTLRRAGGKIYRKLTGRRK